MCVISVSGCQRTFPYTYEAFAKLEEGTKVMNALLLKNGRPVCENGRPILSQKHRQN